MDNHVITIIGIVIGFLQGIMLFLLSGIKSEVSDVWKRINNHYHEISCGNDDCKKLVTGNIVIPRGE